MTMARPPENHVAEHAAGDRLGNGGSSLTGGESFRVALPLGTTCRAIRRSGTFRFAVSRATLGYSAGSLYWLACLVTLSLVAVALLRIFYHDGTHFLTWLNAFTRYVYLPAYACLAWAIWKRRWILALANLAVVCLHVALLAPDFMRDRRFDSAADAATADASASPTVAHILCKRPSAEHRTSSAAGRN